MDALESIDGSSDVEKMIWSNLQLKLYQNNPSFWFGIREFNDEQLNIKAISGPNCCVQKVKSIMLPNFQSTQTKLARQIVSNQCFQYFCRDLILWCHSKSNRHRVSSKKQTESPCTKMDQQKMFWWSDSIYFSLFSQIWTEIVDQLKK